MSIYSVNPDSIQYEQTRRGINAQASLMKGDKIIGRLDDVSYRIVAAITFTDPNERDAFLSEAREEGHVHQDEAYAMSEYARALLCDAEVVMLGKG